MIVPVWRPDRSYDVGVKATWGGVRLVCCMGHLAGAAATNPWDPGCGWEVEKQAALWAPEGEVEAAKLADASKLWEDKRMRVVALLACGRRKREAA